MEGPIISIIIPFYNAEKFVIETLESVKNQTFQQWECILIDDGSTDDSFNLIQKYVFNDFRFRLYKRPETITRGGCGARNYGFKIATGNFIQWFDADDIMDINMLDIKLKKFDDAVDAVICKTILFKNITKNIIGTETRIDSEMPFIDFFNGAITYYTPGPMWRKSFLQNLGFLFNTKLLNVQEWEFYCKILLKKPNIITLNDTLIFYRKHSNSIWGRVRTKEKIMSQYNATKSIFYLADTYQKKIAGSYFLRLYNFFNELNLLNNLEEKNEVKKEMFDVFYKKPFTFKDTIRLIISMIK